MLVYALQVSSRLRYVLDFIGRELFGSNILLTTDEKVFSVYDGPKINYSPAKVADNEFWICNTGLLFENDIKSQSIHCFETNGYKAFFRAHSGDFSFDVLAASFYLISRYEEYLPHKKDLFGRYAHTESLAHIESFLHLPLVNIWLNDLKKALLLKYAAMEFSGQRFACLATYDIDIAWSYLNKGWWRNTGGFLRSAFQRHWSDCKERIAVILHRKQDPFESYEWLHQVHKNSNIKAIYFFLMAFKQKGVDKNISPFKGAIRNLIRLHDSLYTIGIHPSWQSGDKKRLLHKEIEELEQVVNHKIIHGRQHYIRLSLPSTYQELIHSGIQKDFSMGYGTVNGFRASVASSYYWFDLSRNTATNLRIYPFCFMDANAFYAQKISPAQALVQLRQFYQTIKENNGLMITIWHNNFLGTDRAFAGWRDVYETFLQTI